MIAKTCLPYYRPIPANRRSESTGRPAQARPAAARLHPGAAPAGRSRRVRRLQHRAIGAQLFREGRQGQERDRSRALPQLAAAGASEHGLAAGAASTLGSRGGQTPGQVQHLQRVPDRRLSLSLPQMLQL